MHVIFVYIYYFHGYILYHLLCSIFIYCYHVVSSCTVFTYCYHVLFMYCVHVLISYTVFMYYLCTIYVLFSYIVFLLYFSYYFLFHVLYLFIYFSCTVLCTFHILYSCTVSCTMYFSYTVIFHILSSCTFHILYYHINFSDHFTFLYIFIYHVGSYNLMLQNLSSHSSAMLLRSYHIFSHVIFKSFVLCFMHA